MTSVNPVELRRGLRCHLLGRSLGSSGVPDMRKSPLLRKAELIEECAGEVE